MLTNGSQTSSTKQAVSNKHEWAVSEVNVINTYFAVRDWKPLCFSSSSKMEWRVITLDCSDSVSLNFTGSSSIKNTFQTAQRCHDEHVCMSFGKEFFVPPRQCRGSKYFFHIIELELWSWVERHSRDLFIKGCPPPIRVDRALSCIVSSAPCYPWICNSFNLRELKWLDERALFSVLYFYNHLAGFSGRRTINHLLQIQGFQIMLLSIKCILTFSNYPSPLQDRPRSELLCVMNEYCSEANIIYCINSAL